MSQTLRNSVPLAVACALLAACGGGSGSLADKSPAQIAQAANDAVAKAQSVHMAGKVNTDGQDVTMDLVITSPKGFSGTMALQGKGSFMITSTDGATFYLTPDQQFWTSFGGTDPTVVQALVGKCLTVTSADTGFGGLVSGFSALTDLGQISKPLSNTSSLTKGATTTINGQQAVELKASDGSTIDIATQGTAYPLRISKSGSSGGSVDLDQWDSAGSISAPSGCQTLTDLIGGLASPTP
jgi:hypothetical protein